MHLFSTQLITVAILAQGTSRGLLLAVLFAFLRCDPKDETDTPLKVDPRRLGITTVLRAGGCRDFNRD